MTDAILRHEVRLVDVTLAEGSDRDLTGMHVWVAGADETFRSSVRERFVAAGCEVTCFTHPEAELPAALACPDIVIDGGLMPGQDDAWFAQLGDSIAVLKAMQARQDPHVRYGFPRYVGVVRASAGGVPTAVQGIWSGLAKTVPREVPSSRTQVITLRGDVDPGRAVLACLTGSDLIELTVAEEGGALAVQATLALPMPAGGERIHLGAADTVVMTGGARGIGFAFAAATAERTGCRVLVSGREDVFAHRDEPWMRCTDEEFAAGRDAAFRARGSETLPQVRRRLAARSRMREIVRNLDGAADRGVRIEYVRCDVTDAASVRSLVAHAGPQLAMVVHNAGIDAPSRLASKPVADMRAVIAVKYEGMRNIVAALGDRRLAMLCLVGSLTGRYGGMIGQLDYSAANETLAFAARELATRLDYPVKCLAWPTWDGMGLITNMAAASHYMRPISVEEGVEAWTAELQRASSGEVAFMADFAAVSAQHLVGVPVPSSWPGARRMLSRRFFLGEVSSYEPTRRIVSRHTVASERMPYFASARVDGRPAIPVTAALEYLVNSRDGFLADYASLRHVSDVEIHLDSLLLESEGACFEREAQLIGEDTEGVRLAVTLTRILPDGARRPLATAVLTVGVAEKSAARATAYQRPLPPVPPASPTSRYSWSERIGASGRYPDVFATSSAIAPMLTLPTADLESVISAEPPGPDAGADVLLIDRLWPATTPVDRPGVVRGDTSDQDPWTPDGLRWSSATRGTRTHV